MTNAPVPSRDIEALLDIMAALRDPQSGCPWDLEQSFATIAPFTQEEAAEVAEAAYRGDRVDLCDELGDLLLQVVFHAQMAKEEGSFAFGDVVHAITDKLIRRHPHVFGDKRDLKTEQVNALWQDIKREEKRRRLAARAAAGLPDDTDKSTLAGVLTTLPALERAAKLQKKAAKVGFDWADARLVMDKIREETQEVEEALNDKEETAIKEEIGDLLFAVTNLARHLDISPEQALHDASSKFDRRFRAIEAALDAQGKTPAEATLDEMEALWIAAKLTEKGHRETVIPARE